MKTTSLMTTAACVAAIVSNGAAFDAVAQSASGAPPTAPANEAPAGELAEITVTAQKRAQSINDVGLTITALSGDTLEQRHIASLEDIANTVPGLSYTNTANGNPVYTLRGVGFYETSLAAYPTTSVYLDEIGLPFSALTKHSAFDLERVEVLKGPQGTLFGQNATGGAINFVANKPTSKFEAGGDVSYGRFNEVDADGYIGGALSSTINARFAARIERADGWQDSNTRPGDTLGATRNQMARLLVDFQPKDDVKLTLNLNGWMDKSDTQAPQLIAKFPQSPSTVDPAVANAPFTPLKNNAADWTPGIPFADNRFWQGSVRADVDLAHDIALTSITAYTDYKQHQGDDGDGLPASSLDQPVDDGSITSISQEVRFSNGGRAPLRWVVGGNYEHSNADQRIMYNFTNASTHAELGAIGFPINQSFFTSFQRMTNTAGFANLEFDTTSRLTFKAGARFTQADRHADECNTEYSGRTDQLGSFIYDAILGGAFGTFKSGDCVAVNLTLPGRTPSVLGGVPVGSPGRYVDNLNQNNVSWRGGLDFKASRDLLFYLNVSKGFKAGSFPIVAASNVAQYEPVVQESLLAYETGFKSTLFNRSVQLNGAAFYYDYTNKQVRTKFVDPIFGILDILQNVPKSTIEGVELDVSAAPVRGLTLSANFTYLHAFINRFVGADVSGNSENFAGSPIPFTPRYQAGADADYEVPVSNAENVFIGTSVNYRSSTTAEIGGDKNPAGAAGIVPLFFKIDDYTLVDMRTGVAASDGHWRASLYAKNLFNQYYFDNAVAAFDTIGRYTGRPRTYGVQFAYKMR